MIIIQKEKPIGYAGQCELVGQRDENIKDKEIAKTLETKQLPMGKEVKIRRNCYLYVGDTVFKVWFNGHGYRFVNLSNNKVYRISPGEEKVLGREGEIRVDDSDTQVSRKHLKLRVDVENNLFLHDISTNGTFIDEVDVVEKKKETMKCEKMTPEEVKELKNAKKSKEAQCFYESAKEYKPVNKVSLGNGKLMYITNYLFDKKENDHQRVIGYIKNGDYIQLRLFFKSQSEGAWRACTGLRESDGKYSKGEKIKNHQYETTTKVVPELGTIFNKLKNEETFGDPIKKSEEFGADFLLKDMDNEVDVDTLFSSDDLMNYLIFRVGNLMLGKQLKDFQKSILSDLIAYYKKKQSKHSILSSASKIMSVKRNGDKDSIPFDITKGIFDKLVPTGLNYLKMEKIESETYENQHPYFGAINVNVYETTWNGKKIKIHFGSVKKDHPEKIWIDNITYSDDEVNTFGTYKNPINAAPLVGKPADYESQCPFFGDKRMDFRLSSSSYRDLRDLYQDNPIIRHYKDLEGMS